MRGVGALLLALSVLVLAPASAGAVGALLVVGDQIGREDLYVLNADGSDLKRLVEDAVAPLWSPDGTKVAFEQDYGLYVVGSDGTGLTRPTPEDRFCCVLDGKQWSPDGTKLVYASGEGIFVTTVTGQELLAIPDGGNPVWSPDGKWIAFQRDSHLEVMASDGQGQKVYGEVSWGAPVVWSPDSRELAFARDRGDCCEADIFVLDVLTGDERLVGSQQSPAGGVLAAWSPDGRVLAFTRIAGDGYEHEVFVLDVVTGEERRLTEPGSVDGLAWSPVGSSLALVLDRKLVKATPTGAVQVLADGLDVDDRTSVEWSPDGTNLAFVASQDVWVVSASGGPRRLTQGSSFGGSYGSPRWHPRSAAAESLGGTATTFAVPVDPVSPEGVLETRGAAADFAMDGSRIVVAVDPAFESCGYVEFWDVPDGGPQMEPLRIGCPGYEHEYFIAIALAGDTAVFRGAMQTNHYYPWYGSASAGEEAPSLEPLSGDMSGLAGGGNAIFLTMHQRSDDGVRSTLWRVSGSQARAVRSFGHLHRVIAAGQGRIALATPPRGLVVADDHGRPRFRLQFAERVDGAAIDGRLLLVQTGETLRTYDLQSGSRRRVFRTRRGFRLEDAARGIAALRGPRAVSLLRFKDNRRVVVPISGGGVRVQVEDAGLAYAWATNEGGHVKFVPFPSVTGLFG